METAPSNCNALPTKYWELVGELSAPLGELDEDTLAFWAEARTFYDEHVTEEVHEEERQTGNGFSETFHSAIGSRGWAVPRWPEEFGGPGLDAVRTRIVELELERSGAPEVVTQTTPLPAIAVRAFANEDLKAEVLPGIADGTVNICLGYTEPDCGSDLASTRTRARSATATTGSSPARRACSTTGAQFCQYCLCLTRTDPEAAKHRGLTVFLVPLSLAGIEIQPIRTLGGERTNFVFLDGVRLSDHYRIGGIDEGWSVLRAPLAAEHGMDKRDDLTAGPGRINIHKARILLEAAVKRLIYGPTSASTISLYVSASPVWHSRSRSLRSPPVRSPACMPPTCSFGRPLRLLDLMGPVGGVVSRRRRRRCKRRPRGAVPVRTRDCYLRGYDPDIPQHDRREVSPAAA